MYIKIVVMLVAVHLAGSVLSDCGECGDNEEWKECGSCEGTCDDPCPVCTDMCTPPKCQCVAGYVRNCDGKCILQQDCPATCQPCGENEVCQICGSSCTPTCDDPNPVCTLPCTAPKCECIEGYVRNSEQVCIAIDECPAEC